MKKLTNNEYWWTLLQNQATPMLPQIFTWFMDAPKRYIKNGHALLWPWHHVFIEQVIRVLCQLLVYHVKELLLSTIFYPPSELDHIV